VDSSKKKKSFPDTGPGFYTFGLWVTFLILPGFACLAATIVPVWSSLWLNFLIFFAILLLIWNVLSIVFRWYDTPWGRLLPPAVLGNIAGFLYLVPLWRFAGEPLWLGVILVFHYLFCTWASVRYGREIYREGTSPKTRVGKLLFKIGLIGPFGGALIALAITKAFGGIFIGLILALCGTIIILYFTAFIYKLKDPGFGMG
jgi:hypothetical protein